MVKRNSELDTAIQNVDAFNASVEQMTLDRMNQAPKEEVEPQTKLSQSELAKKQDIYLKPKRTIGCKEKFNERYRADYEFAKEYVQFIAENKEIIGEDIDLWTRPFPGVAAEEWIVPTNKPVWGPRYLAEQITKCKYHRLTMKDQTYSGDHNGKYYGVMAVETTINRLDALPVSTKRSLFMGKAA